MKSHPGSELRIDRAEAALVASGRAQRIAGQNAAEGARLRRVLSELAWRLLFDADAPMTPEAKRLMNDIGAGARGGARHGLCAMACRLVIDTWAEDPRLAEQLFLTVARPLGEAALNASAAQEETAAAPSESWAVLAQALADRLDLVRPDAQVTEALAGILRLRPSSSATLPIGAPTLQSSRNGPYLLIGPASVTDHLGPPTG